MTPVRNLAEPGEGAGPPFSLFCCLGSVPLFPLPPSLPPSGASYWCFSPGLWVGTGLGVIKGLGTSDPRVCLFSWVGRKTCLGAGHTLPGTEVPAGATSQEP